MISLAVVARVRLSCNLTMLTEVLSKKSCQRHHQNKITGHGYVYLLYGKSNKLILLLFNPCVGFYRSSSCSWNSGQRICGMTDTLTHPHN